MLNLSTIKKKIIVFVIASVSLSISWLSYSFALRNPLNLKEIKRRLADTEDIVSFFSAYPPEILNSLNVRYAETGIMFLQREEVFANSSGPSTIGTLVADPYVFRLDIKPMPGAQGNLTVTDRRTNKRFFKPGPDKEKTSDSKLIRSLYLSFDRAMFDSLRDNADCIPVTWFDFSNNFGNPEHISFVYGYLYYPTGYSGGKKFEQSFDIPFLSFVQYNDRVEVHYVLYEKGEVEEVDGYYEKVHARAFRVTYDPEINSITNKEELPRDIRAFSAIPLIANGEVVNLEKAIRRGIFQDLRHLFVFPPAKHPKNVRPGEYSIEAVPEAIRAGIFFGLGELTENDYEKAAQALYGPVKLHAQLPISDDKNIDLNQEQTRQLLKTRDYTEIEDVTKKLIEGEYRFISDNEIEIFLKPNPYPHLLFGTTKDGKIFIEAIGGQSGSIGITLKGIIEYGKKLGLTNLMSVSQGTGATMGYIPAEARQDAPNQSPQYYHAIVAASEGRQAGSCVLLGLLMPDRGKPKNTIDIETLQRALEIVRSNAASL